MEMLADKNHYCKIQEGRHGKEKQALFQAAHVGIAGLGGLGSHVAFFLARLGIGKLTLVDFDVVDESNIHRQQYRLCDIGKSKIQALHEQLMQINPHIEYVCRQEKIVPENVREIFSSCSVICEAFDNAEQKAMLAETVLSLLPHVWLVGASGMAGTGSADSMNVQKRFGRYFVCGDGISDVRDSCLFAPRVALCASMQATQVMRLILNEHTI